MKKTIFVALCFAMLIGSLLLCGCNQAGSGTTTTTGAGTTTTTIASPYAGNWVGSWSDTNGYTGTMTLAVANSGVVVGSIVNTTTGTGTVVGSVTAGGFIDVVFGYTIATYEAVGTLAAGTGGHYSGNLNELYGTTLVGVISLDIVRH